MINKFKPDWSSIRSHKAPKWYDDAKLGIFIHWGPYSVPAWAPPSNELGSVDSDLTWFGNNPYAEWYDNSVRIGQGPTYDYHIATYGPDFHYEHFTDMWKAEKWAPASWAKLFRRAGAQYVIPTAKHHDGFCLWDSALTQYNVCRRGPMRNLIGDLCDAVRQEGLRFGVYYSGALDWQFSDMPVACDYDLHHPDNISYAYSDYAYAQIKELIDLYKPSVLWNDIDWPAKGLVDLPYLFSHYYNTVPEGIVNDRWSGLWHDYTTKEYQAGEKCLDQKWECCRGIGLSFGYNQAEDERHLLSPNDLVTLLADTVANNGNLLINIGPMADGTIPESQVQRLEYLGDWLKTNGAAIYGTRLWARPEEQTETGEIIYFTQNDHAIYAIIVNPKPGSSTVRIASLGSKASDCVALGKISCAAQADGDDLVLSFCGIAENSVAVVLQISKTSGA